MCRIALYRQRENYLAPCIVVKTADLAVPDILKGGTLMEEFFPIYVYFGLVLFVTFVVVGASALFPSKKNTPAKFTAYESGIRRDHELHLMNKRFPLRHYLVALLFLVFDIEVIFLYPWAVVSREIGIFAFYEMLFFMISLLFGFVYVWRKGRLDWE